MRLTFSQHISPVFVRHKRWLFGVGLLILITLLYWVLLYATAMPFTTISREGWLGMSRGNGDYVTDPSLTEPTLFVITNEQDVDAFIGWFPILPEQLSENWTTGLLIKKLRQVDFTKECVVWSFKAIEDQQRTASQLNKSRAMAIMSCSIRSLMNNDGVKALEQWLLTHITW
jgi:hypothetical protein